MSERRLSEQRLKQFVEEQAQKEREQRGEDEDEVALQGMGYAKYKAAARINVRGGVDKAIERVESWHVDTHAYEVDVVAQDLGNHTDNSAQNSPGGSGRLSVSPALAKPPMLMNEGDIEDAQRGVGVYGRGSEREEDDDDDGGDVDGTQKEEQAAQQREWASDDYFRSQWSHSQTEHGSTGRSSQQAYMGWTEEEEGDERTGRQAVVAAKAVGAAEDEDELTNTLERLGGHNEYSRPSHVVNAAMLGWSSTQAGEHFEHHRRSLSKAAGGQKLGCSMYRIAPGKTAFPYHYHLANEEAIYVLSGKGTLRLGDEFVDIGLGDYVALPVGEATGHQICNTHESQDLLYLCMSTMIEPDVMIYPDSGKVGVLAGSAPGGPKELRSVQEFYYRNPVGYWEGEV